MDSTAVTISAGKIRVAANVLIVFAFVFPLLFANSDANVVSAGTFIGTAIIILIIALAIAGRLTRTRSDLDKALARLAIGIVLAAWSVLSVVSHSSDTANEAAKILRSQNALTPTYLGANPVPGQAEVAHPAPRKPAASDESAVPGSETQRAVDFADGAMRMFAQRSAELGLLGQKLAAIDLSGSLNADNLADPARLSESQALLAQYFLLLDERDALAERWKNNFDNYIVNAELTESEKTRVKLAYEKSKQQSEGIAEELSVAQKALANAFGHVLDFAQSKIGETEADNGSLRFPNQTDVDYYNQLLAKLARAAEEERVVLARVDQYQREKKQ